MTNRIKELKPSQELEGELQTASRATARPTAREQVKALLLVFAMFAAVLVVAGALDRIIPQHPAIVSPDRQEIPAAPKKLRPGCPSGG